MIFTHFGISGPAVLILSSYINKALEDGNIEITLDCLPNSTRKENCCSDKRVPKQKRNNKFKGNTSTEFLKGNC